ncbi:hypothetical protein V6Z11_D13G204800 [Gossypium hirsutum]
MTDCHPRSTPIWTALQQAIASAANAEQNKRL